MTDPCVRPNLSAVNISKNAGIDQDLFSESCGVDLRLHNIIKETFHIQAQRASPSNQPLGILRCTPTLLRRESSRATT